VRSESWMKRYAQDTGSASHLTNRGVASVPITITSRRKGLTGKICTVRSRTTKVVAASVVVGAAWLARVARAVAAVSKVEDEVVQPAAVAVAVHHQQVADKVRLVDSTPNRIAHTVTAVPRQIVHSGTLRCASPQKTARGLPAWAAGSKAPEPRPSSRRNDCR
jgi:hypothetical protein